MLAKLLTDCVFLSPAHTHYISSVHTMLASVWFGSVKWECLGFSLSCRKNPDHLLGLGFCCYLFYFHPAWSQLPSFMSKRSPVSSFSDYRPVALTSVIMKCFESFIADHIKASLPAALDPHQFAHRANISPEDAITTPIHTALSHVKLWVNYGQEALLLTIAQHLATPSQTY